MTVINAVLGGRPVVLIGGPGDAERVVELDPQLLGLDVESTYMTDREQFDPDFRVRTVQLATDDGRAYVLDLDRPVEREAAESVLADPRFTFTSHTQMDPVSVWVEFGIDISARWVDTHMLATQADPDKDEDRDLKTLAGAYGMPELEVADAELRDWRTSVWPGRKNAARSAIDAHGWNALATMPATEWPEMFTRYAGLDALACRWLANLLVPATQNPPELIRADHWLTVRAVRRKLSGLRVDTDALGELLEEARRETGEAKQLAEEATEGVNINGPKVLGWLADHGVSWDDWPGARTSTGSPSLAKDNIKLLRDFPLDEVGSRVVEQMIRQRGSMDLLRKTEAIDARLVTDGGVSRIHPTLNPLGASTTARMSSSGPNVQNFSKADPRMRGLFLPEPGYVLATIDFAQVELRVVAALAREQVMIDTIKAGEDLHQLTVDLLAGMGITITRDTGKMGNFLIVYGGGPNALHQQAGIPLDVAAQVVYGMREQYPAIAALTTYLGYQREAIRTVSNRRLPVTVNRKTGDVRSYANINYAVQSAARELLVDAWRRLESDHNRPGIVWWPIHDELVLHIPEDEVDAVLADAEDSMRMEFRGVPITADAVVLRDRTGTSRWMTSKLAEKIAEEQTA